MSEERNDISPRRRRIRTPEETEAVTAEENLETAAAPENGQARQGRRFRRDGSVPFTSPDPANPAGRQDTAQTQGPYSRVPEEARRMSASPYGAINAAAVRQSAASQAAFRNRTTAPHSLKSVRAEAGRRPPQAAVRNPQGEPMSRVRVGYAPGRMSEVRMTNRETNRETVREQPREQSRVREYPNPRYPSSARPVPGRPAARPVQETPQQEPPKRRSVILHVLASTLIVAGAFLAVILMLPKENNLRQQVSVLADKATEGIRALAEAKPEEQPEIRTTKPEQYPSADNISDLQPDSGPADDRTEIPAEETETAAKTEDAGENAGAAEESAPGQTAPEETAAVQSPDAPPAEDAETTAVTEQASADPDTSFAPELTATALVQDSDPEPGEENDPESETEPETETELISEMDLEPIDEPETEPEPVQAAPLTAEAVPAANPGLITKVDVYTGKKPLKEYSRAAKELIHMPSGWAYTKKQIGILTFRGNAFRTNGAVGTVESAGSLSRLWEAESGSAKGSKQTYYGTGWTGQPVIVKWSQEVREKSNIYDAKKEISGLKEVIIAGLDGNIRFLNLETGELTRNSIKLGYPMRGTPSVHPSGYPYMSVGQFARNMKSGTGKIGLRQYNLYSQNEITLIDGTDKSMKRALNSTGSFETSALIDRTSDTAIVAGSNGLLYLISLNSEFDWQIGIYKSKQSVAVMRSRAKGQKNAMTAVESSPAMYDKYVFYADMGGILRCVDTNFLSPVWAVDTKDAVMAAIALDMPTSESLDLYTANMLKNRKSGNVQIRRYDAMSGKEIWCVEVGVKKDKKNNTDTGCKASPVIGENGLSDLVYFTVTGLSDEGREKLGLEGETKAALLALEKTTGEIRWAYGLSDRSKSSPIAVYDEGGNGWIIQCAWDGSIVLLDGLSGELVSSYQVDGNIEASPAAYNDIMVIGTTGKGTEKIYGIKIGPAKSADQE